MTRDQLQQKTSRGETYADVLRILRGDWETPASLAADDDIAQSAEGRNDASTLVSKQSPESQSGKPAQ